MGLLLFFSILSWADLLYFRMNGRMKARSYGHAKERKKGGAGSERVQDRLRAFGFLALNKAGSRPCEILGV